MKRSKKIATAVALALGLGLAAGAYAHPGQMRGGMGQGMHGGMQQGMQHGGQQGRGAANALVTPEERTAFQEKMRGAKTPEERRQIAQAHRAEVQKRAQERGITVPEGRGPRGRFGTAPTAPTQGPQLPTDAEHVH
jgi:hypothetical protein